jgi:hypothetical protein
MIRRDIASRLAKTRQTPAVERKQNDDVILQYKTAEQQRTTVIEPVSMIHDRPIIDKRPTKVESEKDLLVYDSRLETKISSKDVNDKYKTVELQTKEIYTMLEKQHNTHKYMPNIIDNVVYNANQYDSLKQNMDKHYTSVNKQANKNEDTMDAILKLVSNRGLNTI